MPDPTTPTWRLVPVEPTPEMLANAMKECGSIGAGSFGEHTGVDWDDMRSVYEAMLAASPAPQELPPVQLPEPVPPVLVRDLAEIIGSDVPTVCKTLVSLGFPERSTNMAVGGEEALAVSAAIAADRRAGGR